MQFNKRDFEMLHISKIRLCDEKKLVISNYFFCNERRMIMINKSKKFYRILASSQCNFDPIYHESVFDVVYSSTDFEETVKRFNQLVKILIDFKVVL